LFTLEQFSQLHQALEKGSENVSRWVWANYQIKKQQLQDTKETIQSFVKDGKFHAAYQELCKYIVIAQSFRWQEKSTRSYTSFFQELSPEQKSSLPLLPESQKKFTPPSK
jgi:hypothetical protein